jgi:8-oxo-dGTP pyrophosphatase MutT (NUDIX family)
MLRPVPRVACAILVDPLGRLLLQLRDGNTAKDPHRWGPPGGRVEPGEDPYDAAVRELEEETGVRVTELDLFWSGGLPAFAADRTDGGWEFYFYCGATDVTQDEVVCNEGADMRFVDAALISDLDLTRPFAAIAGRFLQSTEYAALRSRVRK